MRPVVDIIGDVITAMKPLFTDAVLTVNPSYGVNVAGVSKSDIDKLFVGERVKLTFSSTVYGTIRSIAADSFIVDCEIQKTAPSAISVVLNYHYGHLLEIKNIFQQATAKASLKLEQFPAIILVQDFPEATDRKQHTREATLRIIILTDSKQSYIASERYTNIFKAKLYPLEDLFLTQLDRSNEISGYDQGFTRWDRLFWGRAAGEGTASNIFNDYIDAIELENLKIKILNTC